MSYIESKGPAVHVTEVRPDGRPSTFNLGMAAGAYAMILAVAAGVPFDINYARKNTDAIEHTVEADGMHLQRLPDQGNGIAIGKTAHNMTLEFDGCVLEGVTAHLTRGKDNAITDTSHYAFDAGTTQMTTYRFENAADLRSQLGDQRWMVCKPNTSY